MSNDKQFTWQGEKNRPVKLSRNCGCGCTTRGGVKGVGYISGSNYAGEGFTIHIEEEEVFRAIAIALGQVELIER